MKKTVLHWNNPKLKWMNKSYNLNKGQTKFTKIWINDQTIITDDKSKLEVYLLG